MSHGPSTEPRPWRLRCALGVAAVLMLLAAGAFAYLGLGGYDIAADEPHWAVTQRVLDWVRIRSVERRSREAAVPPDLGDAQRIAAGAGEYAEMCAECHRAPGRAKSELREGLNPRPPDLTQKKVEPRAAFWTIKHGIKMSGMPAWGASHDDATIWNLVAFIRRLPSLDAREYERLAKAQASQGRSHHE